MRVICDGMLDAGGICNLVEICCSSEGRLPDIGKIEVLFQIFFLRNIAAISLGPMEAPAAESSSSTDEENSSSHSAFQKRESDLFPTLLGNLFGIVMGVQVDC